MSERLHSPSSPVVIVNLFDTAMLHIKVTLVACIAAATGGAACNTAAELAADLEAGGSQSHGGLGGLDRTLSRAGPLTLLPQDKGNESPACLDGSPYGFYFSPSKTGSTKWTISIEGGGESERPHSPCSPSSTCTQQSVVDLEAWSGRLVLR